MWLYSLLHLSGFDLPMEELVNFRQLHSMTPGHPEYRETPGVETTTGPLGQGFGTAVGQALGLKILGKRFNTSEHTLFDSKVFVLTGDGCMMEGVSSETASLAGHLGLDNLICIYDANDICLDGPLSESCSEDTGLRFEAYGWDVIRVDGHNLDEIHQSLASLREEQKRPCLIIAQTTIGKGAPNKAGTHKVHGSPLGPEEVAATKEALGLPVEDFYVPQPVRNYFSQKQAQWVEMEAKWSRRFDSWAAANPDLAKDFQDMLDGKLPENLEEVLKAKEFKPVLASRVSSNECLQVLGDLLPQLYGGSADLSCSDMTMMKQHEVVAPGVFQGRNIKYGVREFGMAAMANGLCQTQMIRPYIGTFLTFSDYMRNAIRLAALQELPVIYQFTHDSIFLGEDGPTHQSVEQVASLRAIPNLHVIRPADNHEMKMAWIAALKYSGPTALCLSRQGLPELPGTDVSYEDGVGRGAYIVRKEKGTPDYTFFATGSELALACDVAMELDKRGKNVRVVSMPCWELFEAQDREYRQSIVGGDLGVRVCIEAGVDMGWHRYIGIDGIAITQNAFGLSAPAGALAQHFGFTLEAILERIL